MPIHGRMNNIIRGFSAFLLLLVGLKILANPSPIFTRLFADIGWWAVIASLVLFAWVGIDLYRRRW